MGAKAYTRSDRMNDRIERLKPDSRWQHFRGNIYTIVAIALDVEDLQNRFVIYRDDHRTWSRSIESFMEELGDEPSRFFRLTEVVDP